MSLRNRIDHSRAWVLGLPAPVVLMALAALAIPYLVNLGASSIWDANEAFYACTPREMIESGDYLAPRFNYEVRAQKPPLTYWLVAAAYRLFGISEFSVRLPGALAAIGTIILTFAMARRVASAPYALLAAAIVATTPRIFILARRLPIDILLVFFLTGTAYFLWRASETCSRRDWASAYGMAAMGFMTKGPVALVIPFGAFLLSSVWTRRFRIRSWRPLLGIGIFGALTVPWYVAVFCAHGWTYVSPFFLRDNVGRFASELMGPARGPFFYVSAFLVDYFPWSFLAMGLLALHAWEGRTFLTRLRLSRFVFPTAWCALTFMLFSLSRNKQEYYIAPIYPIAATLLSVGVERYRSAPEGYRGRIAVFSKWCLAVMSVMFLCAGAGTALFSRLALPDSPAMLNYPVVAVLCTTSAILAYCAVRNRLGPGLSAAGAGTWLCSLFVAAAMLPAIEIYRPVKQLCERIEAEFRIGDMAGYYRATVPSMAFYLRRPIFEEYESDAIAGRLKSSQRVFCLMTEADHDNLVAKRGLVLHVLDRRPRLVTQLRLLIDSSRRSERELLLVSNRPSVAARSLDRP